MEANLAQERDFDEAIFIFWREKMLILAIMLISGLICLGYIFLVPQEKSINWNITPLQIAEFDKYQELNTLSPAVVDPLVASPDQAIPFFYVGDKQIASMLIQDLTLEGVLKNEIKQWLLTINKVDVISPSIDDEVMRELSSFVITSPTDEVDRANPRVKIFNENWSISYTGKLGFSAKIILDQALAKSTEHVRKILTNKFETKVNITKRDQLLKKQALEKAVQNIIADYETKTNSRLAFLAEQEKIARALGIAKSTIEVQSFGTTNPVIGTVQKSGDATSSYYLRGFEAIDEEMNLVRNRKDIEAFIPELLRLRIKLRAVEQDAMLPNITTAFAETPIIVGDFKAATYDIFAAKMKTTIGRSIYLMLALLIGLLISIIVVYIKNILRRRNGVLTTPSFQLNS